MTSRDLAWLDDCHLHWIDGYEHGYRAGQQSASQEIAEQWLHERAADIVEHLATVPARDPAVDRTAASRRASRQYGSAR